MLVEGYKRRLLWRTVVEHPVNFGGEVSWFIEGESRCQGSGVIHQFGDILCSLVVLILGDTLVQLLYDWMTWVDFQDFLGRIELTTDVNYTVTPYADFGSASAWALMILSMLAVHPWALETRALGDCVRRLLIDTFSICRGQIVT